MVEESKLTEGRENGGLKWDPWQLEVLDTKGSISIRAGRQVGKSTVIAQKVYDLVYQYPGSRVLVLSASIRQAGFIFEKMKGVFSRVHQEAIDKELMAMGEERRKRMGKGEAEELAFRLSPFSELPTQTRLVLSNGSRIFCYPAGKTGVFVMGQTIDFLVVDEAAYVPEPVWNAVLPMLAIPAKAKGLGWQILLSKPAGKGGYFFRTFGDSSFTNFHVSAEKCPRIDPALLGKERKRLTKAQYAEIWQGEFSDEWNQFFSTELIRDNIKIMEWDVRRDRKDGAAYYLGVDISRYGGDENAFVVVERDGSFLKAVKALTTVRMATTETVNRIIALDKVFNFRKIYIDDAGIGGGPTDSLLEAPGMKRKVIGLNNAKKSLFDDRQGAILKEDLYSNLLVLLEGGRIELIAEADLERSLRSMIYEYGEGGRLKIFGDYSHLAEALVRAAWCVKDQSLKVFIY
jgi:hypothetical protein